MLGPYESVPQTVGFDFGSTEDHPCSFRESLERRYVEGEPLVGCLLADTESAADFRPRMSTTAALVDEMTEQRVTDLFEITNGLQRLRQLGQGLFIGGIDLHAVDQCLQRRRRSHSSTIH